MFIGNFFRITAHLLFAKPRRTLRHLRLWPWYLKGWNELHRQSIKSACSFPFKKPYPCFTDLRDFGGQTKGHYFHQDLLVAQRIFKRNPTRHIDVGSRVDGFVGHVAAFREIEVLDIRRITSTPRNVRFRQADLMNPPEDMLQCCDSLSCLHALEHFGLGRYGDPINYEGHLTGLQSLTALLQPGGVFYLSVPIGPQRINYNAHRVFSIRHLLELMEPNYELDCFSYVDDDGDLHENVTLGEKAISTNFSCDYGCGIFELRKKGPS